MFWVYYHHPYYYYYYYCYHYSFICISLTDSRTSPIYKSTPRFTMRARCTTARWRAVPIPVTQSRPWANTTKEYTRFVPSSTRRSHGGGFDALLLTSLHNICQQVGGMSKYKCHICDKVFSWCYTLTLHLRKKHELKWPSGHSRFRWVPTANYLCETTG